MKSAADQSGLPPCWHHMSCMERMEIINNTRRGMKLPRGHVWWDLAPEDRHTIYHHIRAVQMRRNGITAAVMDQMAQTNNVMAELPIVGMLYPAPNGGNRILPSIYTKLTNVWLKASQQWRMPQTMNSGHIEATLNLLRESNGNTVAKATQLLGRMANHFRNQPEIVADLEALCLKMQRVDVDDMYPIYKVLAAELQNRAPAVRLDPEIMGDQLSFDDFKNW